MWKLLLLAPALLAAASDAMPGDGSPIRYGREGVRGKLAVGLWAHPAGIDFDLDGDTDLVVASMGRPSNGTWYFENLGGVFAQPVRWGPAKKDLVIADFNGDGRPDLVTSGGYYSDIRSHRLEQWVPVAVQRNYVTGRDDLWYPVDWDRDGRIDLLIGVSDWRDYGWDDAFDAQGRWTRGSVTGRVYFHRNTGTNAAPVYAPPVVLPVTTLGSPSPNPVEWFKKGVWDLLLGEFADRVQIWRNGSPAPRTLFHMDLCMIQPRTVQWGPGDGRVSVLIGEEDGTVSLALNLAPVGQEPELASPRPLEQLDPPLKSGVLSRPVAVDWNGDGRLDLVAGNSAGYLRYFENTGANGAPVFTDRGYFMSGGQHIRRTAGPNGSVQGPIEAKWGYSNPTVADWDLDGKLDIVNNDIWGSVHWYRGQGPGLALGPMQDMTVAWPGAPPKPDWVWWTPKPGQLVTQWRTTPEVVDWDRDGLPDLVMLDWRGYLALYRRVRRSGGRLELLPPERIFVDPDGRFLQLARGRAGASGRRKIEIADWDGNGTLDLLTDTGDGVGWYSNTGTHAGRTIMQWRGSIVAGKNLAGHNPTPNTADWNGDGKLDLIIGAEDGLFYYFERNFLDSHPAAKP